MKRRSILMISWNQQTNRKAFTLIELLAVIVILAIIALIAVPITLGIINDSKDSADKRSIEMYGRALELALTNYELNGTSEQVTFEKIEPYIEYGGNKVECETTKINNDRTIYLAECKVEGKQVDYTYGKEPPSFAKDDWSTIVSNIREGNTSVYEVGDTKEIDLGELGKHTVRIANISTPEECNTEGFSQTACGFVIEFADIIIKKSMNPTYTNTGGWKDCQMRPYVNETIYNSLPMEIRQYIIDTYVVSGHASTSGEINYETTDKLYLLSTKEIWGKDGTSNTINYDTAEKETRQLDYYKSIGVTTSNYSGAIKNYNGNPTIYWLRSIRSSHVGSFYQVIADGSWNGSNAYVVNGVSPAFRIG